MSINFQGAGHGADPKVHIFRQDSAPTDNVTVGDLWVDTTNDVLKRCTGTGPITFTSVEAGTFSGPFLKSIVIEDPTASENITFFFTDDAITITQVNEVLQGSSTPSVDWNIRHATARDAGSPNDVFTSDRTTTSTSGAETTSFNDATIPAGSWVWIITSAQSGTVDELAITIEYTVD